MVPKRQFQPGRGRNDLIHVNITFDDHRGKQKQWKVPVDLGHGVITTLIKECNKPRCSANIIYFMCHCLNKLRNQFTIPFALQILATSFLIFLSQSPWNFVFPRRQIPIPQSLQHLQSRRLRDIVFQHGWGWIVHFCVFKFNLYGYRSRESGFQQAL